MTQFLSYFALFIGWVRPALFVLGVLVALVALLSWSVRTRRISPFSPLARFVRESIDPVLIAPMERRILRAGGTPASAPWWTLAVVIAGAILLLWVLQFIFGQLMIITMAVQGNGISLVALVVGWTFSFLRIAIMARVISSWVGGSAYSKWWRWAYVSTEWLLGPLRRIIPTIGPIDISPLVAYFGLGLLENLVMGALR